MRHCAILTVILGLLATSAVARTNLPQTGECTHEHALVGAAVTTSVKWSDGTATLNQYSENVEGRVFGLRPHEEGFKLSILYEDPITGPAEMVIFEITDDDGVRHRRAIVGYNILPDGSQVVSHVIGFEDITCSVLE